MNGWIVHKVLAFNGSRGIIENLLTGETVQFYAFQVKPQDRSRIHEGEQVLVTDCGYIEDAQASFLRFYGEEL